LAVESKNGTSVILNLNPDPGPPGLGQNMEPGRVGVGRMIDRKQG
jgi:hypothetical protein